MAQRRVSLVRPLVDPSYERFTDEQIITYLREYRLDVEATVNALLEMSTSAFPTISDTSPPTSTSTPSRRKRSREPSVGLITSPQASSPSSTTSSPTTKIPSTARGKRQRAVHASLPTPNVGVASPSTPTATPSAAAAASTDTSTSASTATTESTSPVATTSRTRTRRSPRATKNNAPPKSGLTTTGPGVGMLSPDTLRSPTSSASAPAPAPSSRKRRRVAAPTPGSDNVGFIVSPTSDAFPATTTSPASAHCASATPRTAPPRTRSPTLAPSSPDQIIPLPHTHQHPIRESYEPISAEEVVPGMNTLREAVIAILRAAVDLHTQNPSSILLRLRTTCHPFPDWTREDVQSVLDDLVHEGIVSKYTVEGATMEQAENAVDVTEMMWYEWKGRKDNNEEENKEEENKRTTNKGTLDPTEATSTPSSASTSTSASVSTAASSSSTSPAPSSAPPSTTSSPPFAVSCTLDNPSTSSTSTSTSPLASSHVTPARPIKRRKQLLSSAKVKTDEHEQENIPSSSNTYATPAKSAPSKVLMA